jgi:hypothetical protein
LDQRRFAIIKVDGSRQAGRQENRQGFKAFTRRNYRDGSEARDIVEHDVINSGYVPPGF